VEEKYTIVFEDSDSKRLDSYLSSILNYSRTKIQGLISTGFILINGISTRSQYRLKQGDQISVTIPPPKPLDIKGEDIPLDIIYEDDDFAVINKSRGMVVHPATSHENGTLVNAILYHFNGNVSPGTHAHRPGIIHRLDKGTSGAIIITKTEKMQNAMSEIFMNREIKKEYIAIVKGKLSSESGRIELPIKRDSVHRKRMCVSKDGKNAITLFNTIEKFEGYTSLSVNILTGRTHQIRVHFSYLGNPIVNDSLYGYNGESFDINGFALHAKNISFVHPFTNKKVSFEAPIPDDFSNILKLLRETK
jgi:23S rRNA pseudouridine1911/1915/1917 synthase